MNVGVIGIGYWGKKVVREYIDLYKEELIDSIALCDSDETKLEPFKEEVKTYTDTGDFISDRDAVHICTNNQTHYDIAKAALMNGTNVLVEKPMTMNHGQAYNLAEMASERGLVLQVGHIFRFANVIRKVRKLYVERFFGDIRYCKLEWTSLMPSIKGLDIIWNLLPHPLDIINFVTGELPSEFVVTGSAYRREELNEVAFIQADFERFFANIAISWLQPIRRREMDIVGSKRSAVVDCVGQEIERYL
jgi:predicted dehydrogenase